MMIRVPCWRGCRAGALVLLILLAGAAPAQQAPPDAVLARIRSHMAENLRNLPNYVCVETIERSRRLPRALTLVGTDRLKLEVAHVGERELYAWPGDEELGKLDLGTLAGGGMIANGAFALRARVLFLGNDAIFHFAGREQSRGRELLRYDFRISAGSKHFMLVSTGAGGFVGEHGSFWADAQSLDIARLASEAGEIPPDIGIRSSSSDVEYRRSAIAGSEFLLPARAEVRLAAQSGEESRNVTTFSSCRKYGAESTLSFDLPAEGTPADQPRPRAVSFALPAGLELSIELGTPIDNRKLFTGDPIEGRLNGQRRERRPRSSYPRARSFAAVSAGWNCCPITATLWRWPWTSTRSNSVARRPRSRPTCRAFRSGVASAMSCRPLLDGGM